MLVGTTVHRFGPFEFDSDNRSLTRNGEFVDLPVRHADLLYTFLTNPGRLFTKDELVKAVWGDTPVGDNVVEYGVWNLRKKLREEEDRVTYIETKIRKGYRWVMPVDVVAPRRPLVSLEARLAPCAAFADGTAAIEALDLDRIATARPLLAGVLRDEPEFLPGSSHAREQFATVAAAVAQLGTYAVSRMSAGRRGKSSKALAREALFGRLEDFGRTARAIAQDTPGLEDKFHLPEPQTDQALITAGRLFAQDAGPFTAQFVGHAMPATFIADLIALVDRFEQAIHERETGKDDRTAARTSIEEALALGTNAALRLDAIVANHLKGDPVPVSVWKRDRRIGYPNRSRKHDEATKPAAIPPATPPSAVPVEAAATPEQAAAAPQTT